MSNLLSISEPTVAQLVLKAGPTNALIAISGFNQSIQLSASTDVQFAYMQLAPSAAGVSYVVSVHVQMDDNSTPVAGVTTVAPEDFTLIGEGALITPTVTSLGNNVYRVWGVRVSANNVNSNWGIVKYPAQSIKSFRFTGYQIEQSANLSAYEAIPTPKVFGACNTNAGS